MTLAYWTWVLGHVVVGVVLELLGQDQQAVQRGAELVGHVGDELGLVLRRDRQLGGLLLEESLGLLDLLVPVGRLPVALGQEAGLALEALVGLAELALLGTELLGQGLGLLEQGLGEGRGLDGAQDDPDALGDRVEEGLVGDGEGEKEASSITARSDPFEQDGEDDDVAAAATRPAPS